MTALEQQRLLKKENQPWSTITTSPLGCRIGLHFGEAIVGNMGSEDSQNYTVIGDSVILASRLESANRQYGTNILISEDFRAQLDHRFLCRPLDRIVVKGKTKPVEIYELVEEISHVTDAMIQKNEEWTTFIENYWERRFSLAAKLLDKINDEDPLVMVYRQRCQHYLKNPPQKDWMGETLLTEK